MRLFLIPTAFERSVLERRWPSWLAWAQSVGEVRLCGFGPVVAAARTAQLVAERQPDSVWLLGIAGAYDDLEMGAARRFSEVAIHGIGFGSGDEFVSAEKMGWQAWAGDGNHGQNADEVEAESLGDTIRLPAGTDGEQHISRDADDTRESEHLGLEQPVEEAVLLTCCAAAKTPQDVARRRQMHPLAVAEDMEGYAVAAACRLARVPLAIVRGISNVAGQRDKKYWDVEGAMRAAAALTQNLVLE